MLKNELFSLNEDLNSFIFDSFVNKKLTIDECIRNYSFSSINQKESKYCVKYIRFLYDKMSKESNIRKVGYIKTDSIENTILNRFIQSKKSWVFLPQIKIAEIFGCSQKTVSRHINRMIKDGIILLHKAYKYGEQKANEYILTKIGLEKIKKMCSSIKHFYIEKNFKTRNYLEALKKGITMEEVYEYNTTPQTYSG